MSSELKKQMLVLQEKYIQGLPGKMSDIRSLWNKAKSQCDYSMLEDLHRAAHSLSGSGATFDKKEISVSAKSLENCLQQAEKARDAFSNNKIVDINELIEALENTVDRAVIDARRHSKKDSLETTKHIDVGRTSCMKILVADDDDDVRDSIVTLLSLNGHEVYEAKNGEEALVLFEENSPEIVILDVIMPVLTGYEAAAKIKRDNTGRFVPIIFLTQLTDNESLAKCISAGGDDFLTKPVHPLILGAKIQAFQRIRNMYNQLDEYQRSMEEELETSEHIFNTFISEQNDMISGLQCWARSPGHFSGDSRLFKKLENGSIYILLCDFTGHGLPAAIGTIFVADLFRSMTAKGFSSEKILNEINKKMNLILPTGRYCAAIMADYNPAEQLLKIWNCGLPTVYIANQSGQISAEFPSMHVPLGVIGGEVGCDANLVQLNKGDSLVLYSDGVTDAENYNAEMYGEERFLKVFDSPNNGENLFNTIKQDVERFIQDVEPADDISLIVFTPVNN